MIVSLQLARIAPSHSSLRYRRLPRPCRGVLCVSALSSSVFFSPRIDREHSISSKIPAAKLFRINAHFARFFCHLSPFRINTSKTVSKQRTLSIFRINTFRKRGGGWPVIVNQTHHEVCLSRATIGSRRISPISDEGIYPASPEPRKKEHRDEGRFDVQTFRRSDEVAV